MAISVARNTVNFSQIRSGRVTYLHGNTITYSASSAGGSASVGLAVTLSANKTVQLAADGEPILGRLEQVFPDGTCAVTEGPGAYVKLPAGDGATVTAGSRIVGALGAASAKGYIRNVATPATPTAAEVIQVLRARHTIVDATTSTAVVVKLD